MNPPFPTSIDIGHVTLEHIRPDRVIVRFKPGALADAASFQLSMAAGSRYCILRRGGTG